MQILDIGKEDSKSLSNNLEEKNSAARIMAKFQTPQNHTVSTEGKHIHGWDGRERPEIEV